MTSPAPKEPRPAREVGQFAAVLWTGLVAMFVAAGALFGFAWLVARRLPWQLTEKNPHLGDVVKLAFAVVAGIGGVVALVVAYRRQRTLERDDAGRRDQIRLLTERFGSAAQQLGDKAAPVRLAGVYAMAAVADEWEQQRQQCIDVLCGYLRLPYTGDPGAGQPSTVVSEHTWTAGAGAGREILTYDIRAGEREVRQSIVRVITVHLRTGAVVSWSDKDFDFAGALFEDANFAGATFSDRAWFVDATFSGELTSFVGVTFSGQMAWFDRAAFSGELTSFADATFSGQTTSFDDATFSGQRTSFDDATFSGQTTAEDAFRNADFRRTHVDAWGPVPPRP